MPNNILFIFEGEKAEAQIALSMQRTFLEDKSIIKCVFGAEIYQIYKIILNDPFIDTFSLIKERYDKNGEDEELARYSSKDFAEIYLFFDYDGHSSAAADYKLEELLSFFDEETDKGKLYISYPMVEALKHISTDPDFKDLTVHCKSPIEYKAIVGKEAPPKFNNMARFDKKVWTELTYHHLAKMNYVMHDAFELPRSIYSPLAIFKQQFEKYISPSEKVAVLSAFPLFLHDYFGNDEFTKLIRL